METIRSYILSVICSAILCAICKRLISKHAPTAALTNSVLGLFLFFCVISPFRNVSITEPLYDLSNLRLEAQNAANAGTEQARNLLCQSIIQRVQAYVEEQGSSLGATLKAEVSLSNDAIPVPISIHIYGDIAPYAKAKLQQLMEANLGVQKENQIWH